MLYEYPHILVCIFFSKEGVLPLKTRFWPKKSFFSDDTFKGYLIPPNLTYCDLLQAKIEINGVVKQSSPLQLTMTTLAMSPFLLEPFKSL